MKWENKTINDLCEIKGGKRLPKNHELIEIETNHPYIRARDIGNGIINFSKPVFLQESTFNFISRYIVEEDDIVLTIVGANIGDVGLIPKELDGANLTENAVKLTSFNANCHFKYLLYYFLLPGKKKQLEQVAAGSAQGKLGLYKIKDIEVPIPPLPTQHKIASILSAYDDLIENNLKRIKLLEEKAFLRYKGIVRSEKNPLKAFDEVASYINGFPFKPVDLKEVGLPIIKIKELKGGIQNDTPRNDGENVPEKYLIENKDILFAWSASIGAYLWCSGKSILNQHIFNVKPFDKEMHNWIYFSLLEKIPDFINLSNGATMQHIKKSALGLVFLPVPSKKVCKDFQEETEPILDLIVNLKQQNTKLREARDILLPKLMNGQIEVWIRIFMIKG